LNFYLICAFQALKIPAILSYFGILVNKALPSASCLRLLILKEVLSNLCYYPTGKESHGSGKNLYP